MKGRGGLPGRACVGDGLLVCLFAELDLFLSRLLVPAAGLVVVTGARVVLAPSHREADRAPCCGRHHVVNTENGRESLLFSD